MDDYERLAAQVEALFYVDGPHSGDKTTAAAAALAHLVRYMCHATYSEQAVPYPSTVDSVTRNLHAAVVGMDQLLRQLGDHMDRFEQGGRLRDDAGRDPYRRAMDWRMAVRDAQRAIGIAATWLEQAGAASSHLGLRDPEPDEEDGR